MTNTNRQGAIGALLDEYLKVIIELQQVLHKVSDEEFNAIVDKNTADPKCKSIRTILAHVVRSGFAYANYIRNYLNQQVTPAPAEFHATIDDYLQALNAFFIYTEQTFESIKENEIEQIDTLKKIVSSWGQTYDIEQMMEHAIVHILRHRRQIEKFLIALRGNTIQKTSDN